MEGYKRFLFSFIILTREKVYIKKVPNSSPYNDGSYETDCKIDIFYEQFGEKLFFSF